MKATGVILIVDFPRHLKYILDGTPVQYKVHQTRGEMIMYKIDLKDGTFHEYLVYPTNPTLNHTFYIPHTYVTIGTYQPSLEFKHYYAYQYNPNDMVWQGNGYVADLDFVVEERPLNLNITYTVPSGAPSVVVTSTQVIYQVSKAQGNNLYFTFFYGDGTWEIKVDSSPTSFVHTYPSLHTGTYTVSVVAINHVSRNSTSTVHVVTTKNPQPNLKWSTNSPVADSYLPEKDGLTKFTIEIEPWFVYTVQNITLDINFGDGSDVRVSTDTNNLTMFLDHTETFNYSRQSVNTPPHAPVAGLSGSSQFGSIYTASTQTVTVQEVITGLNLTVVDDTLITNTGMQRVFMVTVATGSHVTFNVTYDDGDFLEQAHASTRFSTDSVTYFYHSHINIGTYKPSVCAWNMISRSCIDLYTSDFCGQYALGGGCSYYIKDVIIVQNYIEYLQFSIPDKIFLDVNGKSSRQMFMITPQKDRPFPTDVLTHWTLTGTLMPEVQTWDNYSRGLSYGQPYIEYFTFDTRHIGTVIYTIVCDNLINHLHPHVNNPPFTGTSYVIQTISGLTADILNVHLVRGVSATVTASVVTGSSVLYMIDFDKDNANSEMKVSGSFPQITTHSHPIVVSHVYNVSRNYTVNVKVKNEINEQTYEISKKIIVQDSIKSLVLKASNIGKVTTSSGQVIFVIDYYPPEHATVNSIFGHWIYPNGYKETLYHPKISKTWRDTNIVTISDAYIGKHLVSANFSNLISFRKLKTNFTMQQEIGRLLLSTDMHIAQVEDKVTVKVDIKNGSHQDIEINLGDGRTEEIKCSVLRKEVNKQSYELTYDDNGVERIVVNLANSVTVAINLTNGATYNEWLCYVNFVEVTHSYIHPGKYKVSAIVTNDVSSMSVESPNDIVVQYKLHSGFKIEALGLLALPTDTVTFTFDLQNDPEPTDVTCIWVQNNNVQLYRPIQLTTGITVKVNYTIIAPSGGYYDVTVNCSNLVSYKTKMFSFKAEERITNVALSAEESIVYIGTVIPFNITLMTGTDVNVEVDFRDGTMPSKLFGQGNVRYLETNHSFLYPGLYNSTLSITNLVSTDSDSYLIKILPVFENLKIQGLFNIAIPQGDASFTVTSTSSMMFSYFKWTLYAHDIILDVQRKYQDAGVSYICPSSGHYNVEVIINNELDHRNLSESFDCYNIIMGTTLTVMPASDTVILRYVSGVAHVPTGHQVAVKATPTEGTIVEIIWKVNGKLMSEISSTLSISFDKAGKYKVYVKLGNPVGFEEKIISIEVMDELRFDTLRLIETPTKDKEAKFCLKVYSFGTMACLSFKPGDGSELFYYGTGCEQHAPSDITFVETEKALTFTYIYKETKTYTFVVEGSNHVSKQPEKADWIVTVLDKPCSPAKVKIESEVGHDLYSPVIRRKSEIVRLLSQAYDVFCELEGSVVVFAWHVYPHDTSGNSEGNVEPILIEGIVSNLPEFTIPPLSLVPGMYDVTVITEMSGTSGLESSDKVYLKIIPSPIKAGIVGGNARNQGKKSKLELNAADATIDPDYPDASHNGHIKYKWTCKFAVYGSATVPILNTLESVGHQRETLITVDDSRCFIKATKTSPSPGKIVISTSHLGEGAVYNFSVTAVNGNKSASAFQLITIVKGNPPQLEIRSVKAMFTFYQIKQHLLTMLMLCIYT